MIEKNFKKFTKEEVEKECLKYFNGDELATSVWINKYCLKDENNLYELTPDDMHVRIANELARIESRYPNPRSYDDIYDRIKQFKRIVPQGSPMAGIGNNFQTTSLSNCFVVGNKKDCDSYGGILKIDQELVQLQKRRGGVGTDLSFIRPAGSPVKNSAITSTGVVPFMKRYSNSTNEVAQDGRRGALMLSISVKHIDSEAFIDAKLQKGQVTGANISVKIDDDFMDAVVNKKPYIQKYPIDINFKKDTLVTDIDNMEYNKIYKGSLGLYKKIDAEKLWKKIIHNAWASAEPGILFWDTIINESIPDCYTEEGFKTISTNPCFPGNQYILTKNGYYKFIDLLYQNETILHTDNRISYVNIDSIEKPENWKINNNKSGTTERIGSNSFLTKKNANVIELITSKGFTLKCTPDHHIATKNGMIEAKDLTENDDILISIPNNNGSIINMQPQTELEKFALLYGLLQGDGCCQKNNNRIHFDFWGDDKDRMKNLVTSILDDLYESYGSLNNMKNREFSKYMISNINKSNKIRITSAWFGVLIKKMFNFESNNKMVIPEFIMNNSSTNIGKFYLAGLFYCDGSLQGTNKVGYTIRLAQSNELFLKKIQMMLHSNGMIFGLYLRRNEKITLLPNGKGGNSEYKTKKQYELISLGGSIVKYMETIGFLGDLNKIKKFNINHNYRIVDNFTDKIISKTISENEDVYCIKEPITRSIIVNGISTRRCGEITLCPNDSCRLLLLNLFGYVINPFTKNAKFNLGLFKEDVIEAQRYMDDIIDLEIEKIDKILEKVKSDPEDDFIKLYEIKLWEEIRNMAVKGRRTGLGVTGEGDMLAALGLTYGTDEATDFSVSVHKELKLSAYRSSVELAKERGCFPVFNKDNEINNPFILRIKEENYGLYKDMQLFGRRNIALLTIAPAGSVSICTQTTSGIEPAFMVLYKRRRKINPQEKNARVDFVDDEGVAWMEYPVFHKNFELWLEVNGYDINTIRSMTDTQLNEIIKQSPYYKGTAHDINWAKKVEMQGKIQKHVDHSISMTTNIPSDTTEETVSKIYETGWKFGCKGVTIYRDGSRAGVLVSNNEPKKEEKLTDTYAPKRPKRLKGKIHRFQNNLEKWIAVVGLKDGRPYEIFTGKLENGLSNLPPNIEECEVVKNIVDAIDENGDKIKKKRYDIEYVDADGIKHTHTGLNHAFNPEFWNYAKFISGILRHGMPLVYVVELIGSLNFKEDYINTWKNGVMRTLKRYIADGVTGSGVCPICGSDHLEYKEGCLTCMSCGSSRCN